MTFLSPERLWILGLLPLLAAAYTLLQLRRRSYAVRFTNLALLSQVAPKRPGWRRHVAATLFLIMIALMMIGFARPASSVKVPRDRATIMVAVDVSLSMMARDVTPSRLDAAKTAAKNFIDELPGRFNVGVVAFAGNANLVAAPSADRDAAVASLDQLALAKRTAIGEAVFTSLQAVRSFDAEARQDPPPAHIVLLSDGDNTTGRSVQEAVDAARTAQIPVSTIAFGTPYGTVDIEGETTSVSVNKETLKTLAESTQGKAYEAADGGQLREVYRNIGTSLGFKTEHRDVAARYISIALLFALAAGGTSLAWFSRLP
ncbi:VWA domain-containing protein [Actinomadura madurae]|uniref:VWA domain-containing protein n=1 Tax=Actinomadura madurae TaxID=1993 RepID=UPI0020D21A87|nr:VWA domain-containing protein [Actinomadura madurae]MCP9947756.1 VWA domain-containing protein [Actinomadura madurae]MCP9964520.1 VWA domain-containing protein [Actinomadura madurae]MCP9977003.1 VWA domain-containing protein [Actinomadura madurae]MCQ0011495.1 VWA domain-containing protein [Actinomadura madurae]MCQ0013193.1 VWA domain-containing protein [Actinomadura madurae]